MKMQRLDLLILTNERQHKNHVTASAPRVAASAPRVINTTIVIINLRPTFHQHAVASAASDNDTDRKACGTC